MRTVAGWDEFPPKTTVRMRSDNSIENVKSESSQSSIVSVIDPVSAFDGKHEYALTHEVVSATFAPGRTRLFLDPPRRPASRISHLRGAPYPRLTTICQFLRRRAPTTHRHRAWTVSGRLISSAQFSNGRMTNRLGATHQRRRSYDPLPLRQHTRL